MAITQISGGMLQSNLVRNGVNLAFDTNKLYIDVNNGRIGVNNSAPASALDVSTGDAIIGNISLATSNITSNSGDLNLNSTTGNISASNKRVINVADPVGNQDLVTLSYMSTQLSGLSYNYIIQLDSQVYVHDDNGTTPSYIQFQIDGVQQGEITTASGLAMSNAISSTSSITGTSGTFGGLTLATTDISSSSVLSLTTTNADMTFTSGTGLVTMSSSSSLTLPVGTTAQRPVTPVAGMTRYNTDTSEVEYYNGTTWGPFGTVFTVIASDTFTGDGTTVAFTLSSTQTTDSCIVSVAGLVKVPVTDYSVTGTTLTFVTAPASGATIEVRELTTTTTVVSISNGTATISAVGSNVNITGSIIPNTTLAYDIGSASNYYNNLYLGGTLTGATFLDYAETTVSSSTVTTSYTVDVSTGNLFNLTLTGSTTFTFAGATGTNAYSFTLLLKQDATGGWAVTWPTSVKWPAATAPTLTTTAGGTDVIMFFTTDAGTTWYGSSIIDFA